MSKSKAKPKVGFKKPKALKNCLFENASGKVPLDIDAQSGLPCFFKDVNFVLTFFWHLL